MSPVSKKQIKYKIKLGVTSIEYANKLASLYYRNPLCCFCESVHHNYFIVPLSVTSGMEAPWGCEYCYEITQKYIRFFSNRSHIYSFVHDYSKTLIIVEKYSETNFLIKILDNEDLNVLFKQSFPSVFEGIKDGLTKVLNRKQTQLKLDL